MTNPHDPANAVTTECDLPDAPEKVWKALTEPKLLAAWLTAPAGRSVEREVLTAEPNRLLRYRWRESARNDGGTAANGGASPGAPDRDVNRCGEGNTDGNVNRGGGGNGDVNRGGDGQRVGDRDSLAGSGALDSIVTFELTRTPTGGTHLRVVHSDFQLATIVAFAPRAVRATRATRDRSRTRKAPVALGATYWSTRWAA